MAASIAGVNWRAVRFIGECRRGGAFREPQGYLAGGVDANLKICSRLLIAGLDDFKLSDGTHLRGRTLVDSEARPVGCDERCQRRSSHTKNRVGVNGFVLRHCRRCSASRELAWSEPEFRARRERYLGLFAHAASEFDVRVLRPLSRAEEPHINTARPTTSCDVVVSRRTKFLLAKGVGDP